MRYSRPLADSASSALARHTHPSSHSDTGNGSRRWAQPPGAPPQIKASVADGESAVVLLEGEGGVFAWGYPDAETNPSFGLDGARTLTFTLASGPADAGLAFGIAGLRRGPIFNWLVDNYPRLAEWASSASRVGVLLLAIDQFDAEPVFERLDVPAERRLRKVAALRRARERSRVAEAEKVLEPFDLHFFPPVRTWRYSGFDDRLCDFCIT